MHAAKWLPAYLAAHGSNLVSIVALSTLLQVMREMPQVRRRTAAFAPNFSIQVSKASHNWHAHGKQRHAHAVGALLLRDSRCCPRHGSVPKLQRLAAPSCVLLACLAIFGQVGPPDGGVGARWAGCARDGPRLLGIRARLAHLHVGDAWEERKLTSAACQPARCCSLALPHSKLLWPSTKKKQAASLVCPSFLCCPGQAPCHRAITSLLTLQKLDPSLSENVPMGQSCRGNGEHGGA